MMSLTSTWSTYYSISPRLKLCIITSLNLQKKWFSSTWIRRRTIFFILISKRQDKLNSCQAVGWLECLLLCRNLVTLNLSEADIQNQNQGPCRWLRTLARTARSLQVLDLSLTEVEDVDQAVLADLASRCHTLRLCQGLKIGHFLPVVTAAARTVRHFGIG